MVAVGVDITFADEAAAHQAGDRNGAAPGRAGRGQRQCTFRQHLALQFARVRHRRDPGDGLSHLQFQAGEFAKPALQRADRRYETGSFGRQVRAGMQRHMGGTGDAAAFEGGVESHRFVCRPGMGNPATNHQAF